MLIFEQSQPGRTGSAQIPKSVGQFVEIMARSLTKARDEPEWMTGALYATPVRRLDDIKAAKDLELSYKPYA
jgi:glycine dehydrogenase subunit 2